jgi:hypothetical protein
MSRFAQNDSGSCGSGKLEHDAFYHGVSIKADVGSVQHQQPFISSLCQTLCLVSVVEARHLKEFEFRIDLFLVKIDFLVKQ